jgi:hypothetical protein
MKQMQQAAEEQARLMMQDPVDEAALMAAIEKTGKIRTEIAKVKIMPIILVKKTLSPEQIEQVKKLLKERMERHRREREQWRDRSGRRDGEGPRGKGDRGDAWRQRRERAFQEWRKRRGHKRPDGEGDAERPPEKDDDEGDLDLGG